jgi:hypothetical protein
MSNWTANATRQYGITPNYPFFLEPENNSSRPTPGIGVNGGRFFSGDHFLDLLSCAPMLLSSLVTLGILWDMVQIVPGFLESIGYVFGILLASFMLDACLRRDVDNET